MTERIFPKCHSNTRREVGLRREGRNLPMVSRRSTASNNHNNHSNSRRPTASRLNPTVNRRHTVSRLSNTDSSRIKDTRPRPCLRPLSRPMLMSAA